MGLAQVTAAMNATDQPMNFERFQHSSIIKTASAARQKVTDSAAGATAFATGHNTYNGAIAISVSTDTTSRPTLLEEL